MKPRFYIMLLISLAVFSCTDTLTDMGVKIQPTADKINIASDTFQVTTENVVVDYMIQDQDSFLLGAFYDPKYGSTYADILAQVNCPVGFQLPPGSSPDSAKLALYYSTWQGDKYAPMDVNIYQMNLKTFSYTGVYKSNINPADYCDQSILLGQRVFSAKDATKFRSDSTSILINLSSDFVQQFFPNTNQPYWQSESDFVNNVFKGLYITTKFGAASMLNIEAIDLLYFYHYHYNKLGKDTVVNNILHFPANAEVRQVNRFYHPDAQNIKTQLDQQNQVNYVSSPANIQTRVNIPLKRMIDQMQSRIGESKKLLVNSAIMKVEATQLDSSTYAMPVPQYMLLIRESDIDNFFHTRQLPNDTTAILASLTTTLNSSTGLYDYYYPFDLSKMLATDLKKSLTSGSSPADMVQMRLVPVIASYSTSSTSTTSTLSQLKQQHKLTAVTIKSGKNNSSPMRVNMIFTGF